MAEITVMPNGSGAEAKTSCYLETASPEDVMFEQLEWLLDHADEETCAPDCRDCARLEQVQRLLLEPFYSPHGSTPHSHPMAA
jgi:hypothetical protein